MDENIFYVISFISDSLSNRLLIELSYRAKWILNALAKVSLNLNSVLCDPGIYILRFHFIQFLEYLVVSAGQRPCLNPTVKNQLHKCQCLTASLLIL